MLVRSNGEFLPGVFLFTLGQSCHYAVRCEDGFFSFDPGSPLHSRALQQRWEGAHLPLRELRGVFLTHGHVERVGGVGELPAQPEVKIYGSESLASAAADEQWRIESVSELQQLMNTHLEEGVGKDTGSVLFDTLANLEPVGTSRKFELGGGRSMRILPLPLHTANSLGYFILPDRVLVCDEGLGFYNPAGTPAPGVDALAGTPSNAIQLLEQVLELDARWIALPYQGVLQGELVLEHICGVRDLLQELDRETKGARANGVATLDIATAIREQIYIPLQVRDRAMRMSVERSAAALIRGLTN